jgi:hypothetical protein
VSPAVSARATAQRWRISSSSWNVCRIGWMTACSSIESMQYRDCQWDWYSGVSSRSPAREPPETDTREH